MEIKVTADGRGSTRIATERLLSIVFALLLPQKYGARKQGSIGVYQRSSAVPMWLFSFVEDGHLSGQFVRRFGHAFGHRGQLAGLGQPPFQIFDERPGQHVFHGVGVAIDVVAGHAGTFHKKQFP